MSKFKISNPAKFIFYIFAGALFVRLLIILIANPIYDDAFITFRIAKNIANGNGFVYNLGEPVLTATSFLYTIFSSFLWYIFNDNSILILQFIGGFFDSLVSISPFFLLNKNLLSSEANPKNLFSSILASLIYALLSTTSLISVQGLETSIYTFSIVLAFIFLQRDRKFGSVIMAAITFMLRPDGILVLVAIFGFLFVKEKRASFKYLIVFIITILPFVVYSHLYFGTLIPQSVNAKILLERNQFEEWFFFFEKFFISLKAIPLGILFLIGLYKIIIDRKSELYPFAFWGFLYVFSFSTFGNWWPWYIPPFVILYALLIGEGINFIRFQINSKRIIRILYAVCIAGLILLLADTFLKTREIQGKSNYYIEQIMPISNWLNKNVSENEIIMLEPLGMIGFYAFEKKFADYPGLVSPLVTTELKKLERKIGGSLLDYKALAHLLKTIKPSILILRESEFNSAKKENILNNYFVTYRVNVRAELKLMSKYAQNMIILKRTINE